MATTITTTSPFIAKLLAPLPANERTVDHRAYMKELTLDRHRLWDAEEAKLAQLRREENASYAIWNACQDKTEKAVLRMKHDSRQRATFAQLDAMMSVPAPTHQIVKWKMGMKSRMTPAARAAIDRDLAWLGPLPVKVPKKAV